MAAKLFALFMDSTHGLGSVLASSQDPRKHHPALPEHYDREIVERLLMWDWLFGTMSCDRDGYPRCASGNWIVEQPGEGLWLVRAYLRQLVHSFLRIAKDCCQWLHWRESARSNCTRA
jgi:hypothetical protein